MWNLQQNAGAVAGVLFTAGSAPVVHIGQHGQRIFHQTVAPNAIQIGDKTCSAGIGFELGNVQALLIGFGGFVKHGTYTSWPLRSAQAG